VDVYGKELIHKTFGEAATTALANAMSTGRPVNIDVLVHSRTGARWLEGDDGVTKYDEDPDASVFSRIQIKATDLGRVP